MSASYWTDAELVALQIAYDRDVNGHDDVVALIRGVRAVLALCDAYDRHSPMARGIAAEIRAALNLDPIGDTP